MYAWEVFDGSELTSLKYGVLNNFSDFEALLLLMSSARLCDGIHMDSIGSVDHELLLVAEHKLTPVTITRHRHGPECRRIIWTAAKSGATLRSNAALRSSSCSTLYKNIKTKVERRTKRTTHGEVCLPSSFS